MRLLELGRPRVREHFTNMLVVTGDDAVGKSFLVNRAMESGFMAEEMKAVEMGDAIFHTLTDFQSGAPATKDRIRNADAHLVHLALGATLGEQIGRAQREAKPLLAIAHVVYEQDGKLKNAREYYRAIRPLAYIHIAADPEQVQEWQRQDTTRSRPEQTVRQIVKRQRASLRATEKLARETGARLITIYNRPDNVSQNVARIRHEAIELFI